MRSERKNCLDCGSPLGAGAFKCRCGWKAAPVFAESKTVSCCYAGCPNNAALRVWTSSGWANVCEVDYGSIEIIPRASNNLTVQKIRDAMRNRVESIDGKEIT